MASPFPGMNPYLEIRYFGQKVIDYTQEPVTPLSQENAAWVDEVLKEKRLRQVKEVTGRRRDRLKVYNEYLSILNEEI